LYRPDRRIDLPAKAADLAGGRFSINDWTVVVIFMVVIGGIGT